MAAEQMRVFKRPDPLRGDRSKRIQNKYCRFHKYIGYTTEECITLKDEIESSFVVGTSRITSMTGGQGRKMTDLN